MKTMTNVELQQKIEELQKQVDKLSKIVMDGEFSSRKVYSKTVEAAHVISRGNTYLKGVADISFTTVVNTDTTDQGTNIMANFNLIKNALNID